MSAESGAPFVSPVDEGSDEEWDELKAYGRLISIASKVAAKELGRHGIRVNSVHPGLIATDMTAGFPEFADDERRARTERNTPLGRLGVPDDIGNMVLFLGSEMSSYCTGQEFVVDGGLHG